MRGLLIPIDPEQPITDLELTDTETGTSRLQVMREAIGGGWLEAIHTKRLQDTIDRVQSPNLYRIVMFVDEEGSGKLPPNPRATKLYAPLISNIYGAAIILGEFRNELEGDDIQTLPDYYTTEYLTNLLNVLPGDD